MGKQNRIQLLWNTNLAALILACTSCGSETATKFNRPSDLPFSTRVWALTDNVHHFGVDGKAIIVLSCGRDAVTIATLDGTGGAVSRPAFQTHHFDEGLITSIDAGYVFDSRHAWVVGSKGVILSTSDGGASWVTQESGTDADLNGVVFANSQRGCAVGDGGTLLVTNNGGVTWVPRNSGTEVNLTLAYFVDRAVIMVGGERGTLLRTIDAGESWAAVATDFQGPVRSFSFLSPRIGYCIADRPSILGRGTELFFTSDGGATWTLRGEVPNLHLSAVHFIDAQNGWLVGRNGVALRTFNGGKTWEQLDTNIEIDLSNVRFISAVRGWAAGKGGTILFTDDGGQNWRRVKDRPKGDFRALAAGEGGRQWLLTSIDKNVIDFFTMGVADDKPIAHETQISQSIEAIQFVDDSTGWAIANTKFAYSPFPGNGSILSTTDGGKTWVSRITEADAAFLSMQFVDSSHGWAVGGRIHDQPYTFAKGQYRYTVIPNSDEPGEFPEGVVVSTSDGGYTWRRQETPLDHMITGLSFVDQRRGWLIGVKASTSRLTSQIYGSDDCGLNWKVLHTADDSQFHSIRFFDDRRGVIVGINPVMRKNVILRTTNSGVTWSKIEVDFPNLLSACCWVDEDNGWAVAGSPDPNRLPNVIVSTSDGGKTWTDRHTVKGHALRNIRFADSLHGWAVGMEPRPIGKGVITITSDGGKTWRDEPTPHAIRAIASSPVSRHVWFAGDPRIKRQTFTAASTDRGLSWDLLGGAMPLKANRLFLRGKQTAFALGREQVARTLDSGTTWELLKLPIDANLESIYFVTEKTGWVVGKKGVVLKTDDGGVNWVRKSTNTDRDLNTVFFPGMNDGWVAGEKGVLLATKDGGTNWQTVDTRTKANLNALQVRSGDRFGGWAVGSDGVMLNSSDGVAWTVRPIITYSSLNAIEFFNERVGWSVGNNGTVLTTTDGVKWSTMKKVSSGSLTSIVVDDKGNWLAVANDELLLGVRDNDAPWLSEFAIRESGDHVVLSAGVEDEVPDQVECESIEFRSRGSTEWRKVNASFGPSVTNGKLTADWNPSHNILPGTVIDVRVTLRDAMGAMYCQDVLTGFTYRKWWDRQDSTSKVAISFATAISCYLLTCMLLLVIWPTALVRLSAILPSELPADATGTIAWMRIVIRGLFALIGPAAFAQSRRVREEWTKLFLCGGDDLQHLPEVLQGDYLRDASVIRAWARRYACGSEEWENVPTTARPELLKHPEVLDAWVERHIQRAREEFHRTRVRLRSNGYVPLPVQINGHLPQEPTVEVLRDCFQNAVTRVVIVGQGGIGKTSLAIAIADRAMSDVPSTRPLLHRCIVVVIHSVPLHTSLQQAVASVIRSTIDSPIPTADDLLNEVLRQRRVLVVIDGFSEFEHEAVQAISAELTDPNSPFNAVIITSRSSTLPNSLTAKSEIRPLLISADRLRSLLDLLIDSVGSGVSLTDDQFHDIRCRLRELVSGSPITPLLMRMFADEAIAAIKTSDLEALPRSIPEMMLQYLNRLKSPREHASQLDPKTYTDLTAIAWAAFIKSCVIQSITHKDAIDALAVVDPADPDRRLNDILQSGMGILHDVGTVPGQLKFVLDPFAEFLIAFNAFRKYQSDREQWVEFFERLDVVPDGPTTIQGICRAIAATLPHCENILQIKLTPDTVALLEVWLKSKIWVDE